MKLHWCALFAACLVFFGLPAGKAAPPGPGPSPAAVHAPKPHRRPSDLYGPAVRRSAQTYLRLKLLELREADLDRARLVIERKLGIDALLGTPLPFRKDAGGRNKP
jgi:hypothetical protein